MQAVLAGSDVPLPIWIASMAEKDFNDFKIQLGDREHKKLPVLLDFEVDPVREFQNKLGYIGVVTFQGDCERRIREEVGEIWVSSILEQVVRHCLVLIYDGLVQARSHFQVFVLAIDIVLLVGGEALCELLEGHVIVVLLHELEL